jgi:hypothetical protein
MSQVILADLPISISAVTLPLKVFLKPKAKSVDLTRDRVASVKVRVSKITRFSYGPLSMVHCRSTLSLPFLETPISALVIVATAEAGGIGSRPCTVWKLIAGIGFLCLGWVLGLDATLLN